MSREFLFVGGTNDGRKYFVREPGRTWITLKQRPAPPPLGIHTQPWEREYYEPRCFESDGVELMVYGVREMSTADVLRRLIDNYVAPTNTRKESHES